MDRDWQQGQLAPRAFRIRGLLILSLGVLAAAAAFFLPPLPQDQAYHNFADQRGFFGVPNCLNVISNAPFLAVGSLGLVFLLHQRAKRPRGSFIDPWERWPFVLLFAGVGLTAFGSAYYHLAPANGRLVWDRLPMAVAFMSLFAAVIAERIGLKTGRWLLAPLVAFGVGSVVYWHLGELAGAGDLRAYLLVQFFPLIAIPLLVVLFPLRYTRSADLLGAAGIYALAKVFELFDTQFLALGRLISGHTLKHLAAALAAYWILRMLKLRRPAEPPRVL